MAGCDEKADTRAAILRAALELIAENGFLGSPTSRIAREAGVGVGSIYRYFKDKEELIHEVFNGVAKDMRQLFLRDFVPQAPVREQFILFCTKSFRYFVDNPKKFAFIEQYFNSPYGVKRRLREMLGDDLFSREGPHPFRLLLERAVREQIIKDLPPPLHGALTFGPIIFAVRDIHNGLLEYSEETALTIIEACWDAVKR
jgi:AcrR family transcriptional regulator